MSATDSVGVKKLTIDWGEADGDAPATWMASWVVSRDGEEGDYFYDGEGEKPTTHDVPAGAIGFRIRLWPPEKPQVGLGIRQPSLSRPYFFEGTEENLHLNVSELMVAVRK